jgi:carboxymethylenebutenolidase
VIEQQLELATSDGEMPVFIAHPGQGGPFPVVLMLMDGMGIRPSLEDVTRRMARAGYYAMLPDLYYRSGTSSVLQGDGPGRWDRMLRLVQSLTDDMVNRDAEALLDFASKNANALAGAAGVMGFCMGGRLSVVLAQGFGDRIQAAVAVHPGNLANDADNSAHRHVDRIVAELYLGIADNDQWCTPEQVTKTEEALAKHGVGYQLELHRGAMHGFGVPGGESYNETASELVWQRVESLFARKLRTGDWR